MITDDQVARLVRDAGHAAPSSLRVDLGAVEQRVAHDRSVARTTGLLSTVAVLLLVSVVWLDPQSKLIDTSASGSATGRWWASPLALLGAVLLTVLATAVASRRAARTELGSRSRRSVAAAWGVLSFLAFGPVVYLTSTFVAYPDFYQDHRRLTYVTGVAAVSAVLAWLAMAARRRALGRGRGAGLTTIWLLASWGVGSWISAAIVSALGHESKVEPMQSASACTLAATTGIALVCAAVLRRRAGDEHPFLRGSALTVAIATILPAYAIGSAVVLGPRWMPRPEAGIPFVVGLLLVALLAARLSLRPGSAGAWLTAALGLAAVTFAASAAIDLWSTLLRGPAANGSGSTLGGAAWTLALAVAAGVCLAAVDRRGGWAPRRDTRPQDEPPAA